MLGNLRFISSVSKKSVGPKRTLQCKRSFANVPQEALALKYRDHGNPLQTLKLEKLPLPSKLGEREVLVKMLAAPINPADLNMVQGNYGSHIPLPAVAGNEGCGVVVEVGNNSTLKKNDKVIPAVAGLGTWRTYGVFDSKDLMKVPDNISPETAATIGVNPATALRLLEDFVELKEGDVILQNGANSAVGIAVMQLAALKGVKTINVIRDRVDKDKFVEIHENLKHFGGDIVISDTYLQTPQFKRLVSDLPAPKLALNCVGGQSATDLARALGNGGTLVTYGGMSRKPVTIPTSLLIFKNIQLKGFWLTKWNEENPEKQKKALDYLFELYSQKKLEQFAERRPFNDWVAALEGNAAHHKQRKIVMMME